MVSVTVKGKSLRGNQILMMHLVILCMRYRSLLSRNWGVFLNTTNFELAIVEEN